MRYLFAILISMLPVALWAQGAFTVSDSLDTPLYAVSDGHIIDVLTHKVVLTVRSNIVYSDTTEARESIELLVRAEDIFAKGPSQGIKNDMVTVLFTISKGAFYLGNNGVYNPSMMMAYYKVDNKGNLALYSGQTNKVIAHINGNDMTTGELTSVFYLLMQRWRLDKVAREAVKVAGAASTTASTDISQTRGSIRKVFNSGQDEFVWDGITIKRKWSSVEYDEWKFDGKSLKRAWYVGDDEFTWDGTILKRKFNTGTDEFEYDGKILRRRWNTGQDEYSIQGNIVKHLWNSGTDDEWEIDGDVPVPVIGMVVFGLLKK